MAPNNQMPKAGNRPLLLAAVCLLALSATVESVPTTNKHKGLSLDEDDMFFGLMPEATPMQSDIMTPPVDSTDGSTCNAINYSTSVPITYPAPCGQAPARSSNFAEFASWQNYSLQSFQTTFASELQQQCQFESCWNNPPTDSWGPVPPCFAPTLPSTNITDLRNRVILATLYYVNASTHGNLVYAHHHSPYWLPPKNQKQPANGGNFTTIAGEQINNSLNAYDKEELLVCNSNRTGIDCTSFTSWVYNFALGIMFAPDTTVQSSMGLPRITDLNLLQDGDLMYFKASPTGPNITHGGIAMNTASRGVIAVTSTIQGDADGPQFNFDRNNWPLQSFAHGFSLEDVYNAWTAGGKKGLAPGWCYKIPTASGTCSDLVPGLSFSA